MMCVIVVFFFKQKTADEMRIIDWSSDVCSSDLLHDATLVGRPGAGLRVAAADQVVEIRCRPGPVDLGILLAAPALIGRLGFILPERRPLGRAPCRARVCQYGYISAVSVPLQTNTST